MTDTDLSWIAVALAEKVRIRRRCRQHDEVDVLRVETCRTERRLRCVQAEIGGGLTLGGDVPSRNPQRCTIHSSEVSTRVESSAFVLTRAGI